MLKNQKYVFCCNRPKFIPETADVCDVGLCSDWGSFCLEPTARFLQRNSCVFMLCFSSPCKLLLLVAHHFDICHKMNEQQVTHSGLLMPGTRFLAYWFILCACLPVECDGIRKPKSVLTLVRIVAACRGSFHLHTELYTVQSCATYTYHSTRICFQKWHVSFTQVFMMLRWPQIDCHFRKHSCGFAWHV